MIGKRSPATLFDVGNVFDVELRPNSFHAQLARVSDRLFSDDDFADLYSTRLGRPSCPPSLLALTLLMQTESGVSDEEAVDRTAYDMRWAAVLRRPAGSPLCAKSTLQLFRAHLVLHDRVQQIMVKSIEEARRSGLLRKHSALILAVDTKPMVGRGAVEDTYNLLARGVRLLSRRLSVLDGAGSSEWLAANGYSRYGASSIKGSAEIDWSDADARARFLGEVVADAKRLLAMADQRSEETAKEACLLRELLMQDVEGIDGDAPALRKGTSPDRVPSASDPDQRHGHKSKRRIFQGHKNSISVEPESQIITSAEVLPGNAGDAQGLLDLVKQASENTGTPVAQVLGDCAYGSGCTRKELLEAEIDLVARVPAVTNQGGMFSKTAFTIDLSAGTATCPAGQVTATSSQDRLGGRVFHFGKVCEHCPLRPKCTRSTQGRTLHVHPQEALLQEARARQATPDGRALLRKRIVVEHCLARLARLGIAQARYFGRARSRYQLIMACAVANLRRTWNWCTGNGASVPVGNRPLLVACGPLTFALWAMPADTSAQGQLRPSSFYRLTVDLCQSVLHLCRCRNTRFRLGF